MGTPTTERRLDLLAINIEGGINSKQSSLYCTKPHQIQQRFGLNWTFFRRSSSPLLQLCGGGNGYCEF